MVEERAPEIPVRFYRSDVGREPVLEWLRGLDRGDRRVIGLDLMRVQFGWPSQRIARLIVCFHQGTLVVLHGFIKKARKTPAEDLALARRRMKEVTT